MNRRNAPHTQHAPRASCRVACVVAALLVTLGGLRLLIAAEPVQIARAATVVTAAVPRRVRPAAPAEVGAYRPTTADFAATVEHAARKVECVPVACGYPRIRSLGGDTLDWTALERRVTAAMRPTFAVEEASRPRVDAEEWVPGSTCRLACVVRLRAPDALAARF